MTYKIKGTGDVRTVWNGTEMIGTIHRKERKSATVKIRIGVSMDYRERTVVFWTAQRVDGSWVSPYFAPTECVTADSMKYWTEPRRWSVHNGVAA